MPQLSRRHSPRVLALGSRVVFETKGARKFRHSRMASYRTHVWKCVTWSRVAITAADG